MREIGLNQNKGVTVVDDVDYEYLIGLGNWRNDGKGYARLSKLKGARFMHRVILERMGIDIEGAHVHHIDGDPLNNTRSNLERLTPSKHTAYHNANRDWKEGDEHGNAQHEDDTVIEAIEWMCSNGKSQREGASRLGMSVQHFGDIVHGRKKKRLQAQINEIKTKHIWKRGNQNNDDEEMLDIVRAYYVSGLSFTRFAKEDGRISRQHLQNVVKGKRLPHLYEKVKLIQRGDR